MSKEVEERVVQMTFENAQFEKAAKQSLETIEEIKKNTDFKPAANAIENSGMTEAIQRIEHSLTSFGGILKRKIFDQLANQVVSSARKMFREIEIEPVQQGFSEYELKMGSVQTIMASTGESLATVNSYLDELNTYADRTIYSFSDMTNNIGKFTNSGVKLEDAVAAIQGISNEAALSGANANEASRAMYNFAQALSSGVVRLIDWKSIENANMATVEFKEELIKTAEELGTIKKQADGTYKATTASTKKTFDATKGFNDALQDQWLTSDVLIKTLARYSDETTDLGKRAYAAAQDVKTFTQLMDTLKEASGSGWAQTWEIIFGDFEEAKELWTGVNNVVSELIQKQSDSRNAMLQQWKDLGGRTELIAALSDAFEVLRGVVTAAVEGFKEFFPSLTGEKLFGWTKKFHDAVETIKKALPFVHEYSETIEGSGDEVYKVTREQFKYTGVLEKIYRIFNGLGSAGAILVHVFSTLGSSFLGLVKMALPSGEGILEFFASIGDRISDIRGYLEGKDFFGSWRKKVENNLVPIGPKIELLKEKFSGFFSSISKWYEESGLKSKISSGFEKVADDFAALVPTVLSSIVDFLSGIIDFAKANETIQSIVSFFQELMVSSVDAAPKLYQKVSDFVKGIFGFSKDTKSLAERFNELTASVKEFVKQLVGYDENGESILDKFIYDLFPGLSKEAKDSEEEVVGPIQSTIDKATKLIDDLKAALENIGQTIVDGFNWVIAKWDEYKLGDKLSKVFSMWMGYKFFGLMGSFTKLNTALATGLGGFNSIFSTITESIKQTTNDASGVFGSVRDVFGKFWENITGMNKSWTDVFRKKESPATALLKAAGAIAILVAAVYVLTKLDDESFISAAEKLGILAVGLVVFTAIFNKLSKGFEIKDIGSQLMKMGVGIILLIGAMALISRMDNNDLVKGLYGLAFVLGELAIFYNLTKGTGFSKDAGPKFISLAASLLILTFTLKRLGSMDLASLTKSVIALGVILFELALFTKFTTIGKDQKLASFVGLGFALLSIVNVMKKISGMKTDDLVKGLIGLGAVLFELVLFSRLANSSFSFNVGAGFLALSVSLLALVQVMKQLAKMKNGDIGKSLGIVTIMLLEMAVVSRLMGNGIKIGKALGLLIALAGSLMLFIATMYLLKDYSSSKMLTISVSFAAIMGSLALVMAVLGKIPVASMVKGIATLGVLAAIVVAMGWAMAALDDWTKGGFSNAIERSGDMLYTVGETLGKFFGGVSSGLKFNNVQDAVEITNEQTFLEKVQGWIDQINSIIEQLKDLKPKDIKTATDAIGVLQALKTAIPREGGGAGLVLGEYKWDAYDPENVNHLIFGINNLIDGLKNSGFGNTKNTDLVTNFGEFVDALELAIPSGGGVGEIFGGSVYMGMSQMGGSLRNLGNGLKDFYAAITADGGIDTQKMEDAAGVLGTLVNSSFNVRNESIFSFLTGSSAWSTKLFSLNLPNIGKGLADFYTDISDAGFKYTSAQEAGWAIEALAKILSYDIPKESIFSILTGSSAWGMTLFSLNLGSLGSGLAGFSTATKDLSFMSILKAVFAAKMLSAFSISLPEKSLLSFFTDQSVVHFASGLPFLGKQLSNFSTNASKVGLFSVAKAVAAAKMISAFAVTLPEKSLLDFFFDKSVADFAKDLPTLGTNLAQFATSIEGTNIDTTTVENVTAAAKILSEFAATDLNHRTFGEVIAQWVTGQTDMEAFASGITAFGAGLNSMYGAVSDIKDWSVVSNAVTTLATISTMVKDLAEGAWTNFEFTGEAFSSWESNGLKEFLTGIADFGTVPYDTGVTFGSEVGRGVIEQLTLLPLSVESSWLNVGTAMVNAASKTAYAMYQMGSVIGKNLIDGLKFPDYYTAGVEAANGFINGVLSKTAAAFNVGATLGKASLEGTKRSLDSHSPSKEFEKLGSYSGEGFSLGLESYLVEAENTGKALGNAALIGAKSTLGYLYSIINSDMNLQPVVRPVVDGSAIQNWVAQNGNLLSGTSYPIRGFSGASSPSYGGINLRNASEMSYRNNLNVVSAVQELGTRVDALGDRIAAMQMVTDTGVMAGEMREHIDNELGVLALRKGRRN